MPASHSEADPPFTGLDDRVLKWVPLVVPLMALFIATMVALIGFEVL